MRRDSTRFVNVIIWINIVSRNSGHALYSDLKNRDIRLLESD